MTNSVSSVASNQVQPQQKVGAMDKVSQAKLYDPGLYALTKELEKPIRYEKKSSGFLGFVGKLLLTGAAVCTAAALTRKYTSLSKLDLNAVPDGLVNKSKHYFAKLGEFVNTKVVGKVVSLFKKDGKVADAAEELATEA